jgi:beta-glucosidase
MAVQSPARIATAIAATLAVLGFAAPAGSPLAAAAPAASCPWVGSSTPVDQRVQMVLAQMSLDDKIAMVHGVSGPYAGNVPANGRLCVPAMTLEDGPAGVADGMSGVTQLPAPVAVAASWDTGIARQYGTVVGNEEAGKGANVNLGPTVNIVRDPRWGRAFESYSEDPELAGQIGAADIQGVQSQGVLAQVKHWAVYNQETNRNTAADNAIIGEQAMHEIYMPAFQTAVQQGQASSAMCSYSTINGTYACEDPEIDSILKDAFGLTGFITSDWGATHSTAASANAGMDMQMPDDSFFGAALKRAVQSGQVPQARLDDMVSRVLREEFRFGLFDHPATGSPSAVVTSPAHAATARAVSEDGTVLLKNSGNLLPLGASTHSVAVIGDDAGPDAQSAGGGSAAVSSPYLVTPFDGIKARAGNGVDVQFAQGTVGNNGVLPAVPSQYLSPPSGTGHGLQGDYFNNTTLSGTPSATQTDPEVSYTWNGAAPAPGVPGTNFSTRWTGTLTPPATGTYTFALTSDDGSRLFVNGQQVIDNWSDHAPLTRSAQVTLTVGQPVSIEVDFYQAGGGDMVNLGWLLPGTDLQQQAVDLAAKSDVAVMFASDFESEGSDLDGIDLPGQQNQLISAVAAANPHTVVVLNTGSAVTMPWVSQVAGALEAWYPGQEDGNAIASLLFGDVNPSGKLPVTFPTSLTQVPAATAAQWPGVNGQVHYSEGVDVGYRWYDAHKLTPLFPFGYGLSYTTFGFSGLSAGARLDAGGTLAAGVTVTNTGQRAGADVVQLYLTLPASAGDPPRQLKGFQKVSLRPGQSKRVTFQLGTADASYWDSTAAGWTLAAGHYAVAVGDSSRNLPLSAGFDVARTVGPRTTTLQAPPVITPGGSVTATSTFMNGSTEPAADVTTTLAVPDGWTATPTTPATFAIVAPAQRVTTTWSVSVPTNAAAGAFPISASTTYAGPGHAVSTPVTVSVPYPNFAAAYNTVGVSDDADPSAGNFDGGGYSFSAQALASVGITPGSTLAGFTWPNVPAGRPDAVTSSGQLVELGGSGATLSFLGAGGFGTQTGTVTVNYTDGSSSSAPVTMADWYANQAVPGCTLVATTPHWNEPPGSTLPPDHQVSLYAASVPLTAGKTIAYLKLPGNSNLHFFATATS